MLAIKFIFTGGKYHATPWDRHANEGVWEWPPSPWRILRALMAVWKTKCANQNVDEETVHSLLNKLAHPPTYHLPPAVASHTRHFMPWNKSWKKARESSRTLVLDSFLSLEPTDPMWVIWENVVLDNDEKETLSALLSKISYLGRAESWCNASTADERSPKPNCLPSEFSNSPNNLSGENDREFVYLLAPELPLKIDALLVETTNMRKDGLLQPRGTRWLKYEIQDGKLSDKLRTKPLMPTSPQKPVRLAVYSVSGPVLPLVTKTLSFAEFLRKAVQSIYGNLSNGASSPMFSGKAINGEMLEGHRHAHFIPLDCDRDLRIDHILIYTFDQEGFSDLEQQALAQLRKLKGAVSGYDIDVVLVFLGEPDRFGHANRICPVLSECKTWVSETPFLLVRHPKVRGKQPDKYLVDSPEDQVLLELQRRGFPEPIVEEMLYRPGIRRKIRWLEFERWRKIRPPIDRGFGFKLEFPTPVKGPIIIGYYCHYGLGLFLPQERDYPCSLCF